MASTTKDKIVVTELSKYGVKVGEEYVNYSKKLSEDDKAKLVPGGTYDCEMYIADSGKRYINSVAVLANQPVVSHVVAKPETKVETPKKSFVAKAVAKAKGEEMTRSDWDAKDRRISRQGIIQVAVQVQADWDEAVKLAEKMLSFVNE